MDFEAFYDAYWRQQGDQFDQRRQSLLTRYVRAGDHVLQVDCGPGVLAKRMMELGAHVVGTDLSAEAVRTRKAEMKAFFHEGFAPRPAQPESNDGGDGG